MKKDSLSLIYKFSSFFSRRERWQIVGLCLMMLVGAGLEAFCLGLFMPFISLLQDPSAIQTGTTLYKIYEYLSMESSYQFLFWIGGALLVTFVFKNIYRAGMIYLQRLFVKKKRTVLFDQQFRTYLYSPYTFHIQHNTAELVRNAGALESVTNGLLVPLLSIATELLVVIAISVFLLVIQPWTTLVAVGVLFGISVGIYLTLHGYLLNLGDQYQSYLKERTKWFLQSLAGIKEAKVLNREEFFISNYIYNVGQVEMVHLRRGMIEPLPRLFLETLTVGGMLIMVTFLLMQGQDSHAMLPLLGIYTMGAFRLMPSLTGVLMCFNTIRFQTPAINIVYDELKELESGLALQESEISLISEPQLNQGINLHQLSYRYASTTKDAVHRVTMAICRGESVAFVGPSGSGKTTLVDLILGLLEPTEGEIIADGKNIHHHLRDWRYHIGYVPQFIYLCDDTVRKNIAFGLPDEAIDDEVVWRVVEAAQLKDLIQAMPQGLDTVVGEQGVRLSGGERQRVGIARALYHDPPVLILDEATSSLDGETESEVTQAIERFKGGKTLIIIAHRLSTVKHCDRLYFLQAGQIVDSGSFEELLKTNHEFERMWAKGQYELSEPRQIPATKNS